ncbi:MAG: TauD/TfdA family dioxygenase [Nitrospira sp.]|nr:TauD/TfdA family dioxygenase [Nitrospira sp.]
MNDSNQKTETMPRLRGIRRKAISLSQEHLVTAEPLLPGKVLPLLVQPTVTGLSIVGWAEQQREWVQTRLLYHGAILFRNFQVNGVTDFEQCVTALSGGALEYRFRASPRTQVGANVYTATDYPPDQSIFPHNEHAYSPVFPLQLFFYCAVPAQNGGETPIGDTREVHRSIDPEIKRRFLKKQIMYVRNYGDGFGLPWPTVFQTEDRSQVEAYCRSVGIEVEWKTGNRLRTRQVGPAVMRHPRTQEPIWFNHGTFFHVSTLEPTIREALLKEFTEEDLPQNTYYGDGQPIEPDVLEHLRSIYQEAMVVFPWQQGDVLLLDNMLALHGRRPFSGPRKILVAMAEACRGADFRLVAEEM